MSVLIMQAALLARSGEPPIPSRPWTPADLPGLVTWYEADSETNIIDVDGRLTQATDLSGNNNHMGSNSTAWRRAAIFEDDLNGRRTFGYGSGSLTCYLAFANSNAAGINQGKSAEALTIFSLARFTQTAEQSNAAVLLITRDGAGSTYAENTRNCNASGTGAGTSMHGMYSGSATVTSSDGVNYGTSWVIQGTQADYQNAQLTRWDQGGAGVESASGNTPGLTPSIRGGLLELGGMVYGGYTSNYLRHAAGLYVRGRVSQADADRIAGYWAHKWGLTASLDASNPYKTHPPMIPVES